MKTLLTTLALGFSSAFAAPFSFVALGDMPYGGKPENYAAFDRLIATVNRTAPSFTVHVGDIKSGSTSCADAELLKVRTQFNTFEQPLIYTPGDNEWTDCHREKAGKFNPLERLSFLRSNFFDGKQSLGKTPMPLTTQPNYPENSRWTQGGVVFTTLHVIGSNNGLERTPEMAAEYFPRNAANLAWLLQAFAQAKSIDAKAVVVFAQADLWDPAPLAPTSGLIDTVNALREQAKAFGKPVLFVHGDSHVTRLDQPFNTYDDSSAPNFWRLEVPGDQRVAAIKVTVDPEDPAVFAYRLLLP
ncbi:hypothetical protein EHF33_12415 [Deinococcus psychrotolerans]|uniref:Calcineurin-like phosphoesterase domain-containing protein n=1 Tax=Deinococcus psychrotolerans TaxID=2489213 RepID=A0A3G8YGX7_9DEIO|nr:hypothetical protein [Deinococcus psychrotolerans]AZI43447.1 hypothetical protein EHF33_12415 [Deinococcus psychrotolerans]